MGQFQVAFDKVMKGKTQVGALSDREIRLLANHDGREFRS
jgi:hypothetical protein